MGTAAGNTRKGRRMVRGAAVLTATTAPWAYLALLARGAAPGDEAWIAPLLGAALIATYAGSAYVLDQELSFRRIPGLRLYDDQTFENALTAGPPPECPPFAGPAGSRTRRRVQP